MRVDNYPIQAGVAGAGAADGLIAAHAKGRMWLRSAIVGHIVVHSYGVQLAIRLLQHRCINGQVRDDQRLRIDDVDADLTCRILTSAYADERPVRKTVPNAKRRPMRNLPLP